MIYPFFLPQMSFAAGQADTRLQKGGRRSDLNSESEVRLKLAADGCVHTNHGNGAGIRFYQ